MIFKNQKMLYQWETDIFGPVILTVEYEVTIDPAKLPSIKVVGVVWGMDNVLPLLTDEGEQKMINHILENL